MRTGVLHAESPVVPRSLPQFTTACTQAPPNWRELALLRGPVERCTCECADNHRREDGSGGSLPTLVSALCFVRLRDRANDASAHNLNARSHEYGDGHLHAAGPDTRTEHRATESDWLRRDAHPDARSDDADRCFGSDRGCGRDAYTDAGPDADTDVHARAAANIRLDATASYFRSDARADRRGASQGLIPRSRVRSLDLGQDRSRDVHPA